MRLRPAEAASWGVARAPELAGPDSSSRSGPRTTSAKAGAALALVIHSGLSQPREVRPGQIRRAHVTSRQGIAPADQGLPNPAGVPKLPTINPGPPVGRRCRSEAI